MTNDLYIYSVLNNCSWKCHQLAENKAFVLPSVGILVLTLQYFQVLKQNNDRQNGFQQV